MSGHARLTPDEALTVNDRRRVTAGELAQARQRIAHEGTGYVPPWDDLTPDEQTSSALAAAGWLRALGTLLYEGVLCTTVRAVWCPVHGHCLCVEARWRDDPGCPLHAPNSSHREGLMHRGG